MDECILKIRAVPNAKKTEATEIVGEAIKVRIQAVPEDGKANKELIAYFSKILDLSKRDISLLSGETSRDKTLKILGKSFEDCLLIITPLLKK